MLLCLFHCLDRCIITEYRVCFCISDRLQRHNNTATMYSFRHPVRSADKGYISRWLLIIKTDQNKITLHVCLAMPSIPNMYEYNMNLQSYLQCTWIRVVFLLWIQQYKSTYYICMFYAFRVRIKYAIKDYLLNITIHVLFVYAFFIHSPIFIIMIFLIDKYTECTKCTCTCFLWDVTEGADFFGHQIKSRHEDETIWQTLRDVIRAVLCIRYIHVHYTINKKTHSINFKRKTLF